MTIVRLANETDAQYIERLTAALAAAKTKPSVVRTIKPKVSEKSGIIVFSGVNANPRLTVNMYAQQLRRFAKDVFGMDDAAFDASPCGKFIASNMPLIKRHGGWRDEAPAEIPAETTAS